MRTTWHLRILTPTWMRQPRWGALNSVPGPGLCCFVGPFSSAPAPDLCCPGCSRVRWSDTYIANQAPGPPTLPTPQVAKAKAMAAALKSAASGGGASGGGGGGGPGGDSLAAAMAELDMERYDDEDSEGEGGAMQRILGGGNPGALCFGGCEGVE